MKPEVRFCTSKDGTKLAYTVSGAGPPIVRAPHWFSHLEHDWSNPAVRPWAEDLSKRYMLLRFDQRGTGLSDREALEQMETLVKLIEQGWGSSDPSFRQVFATQFMPDASLAAVHAFNDLMPLTASARTAATIFKANSV